MGAAEGEKQGAEEEEATGAHREAAIYDGFFQAGTAVSRPSSNLTEW